MNIWVTNSCPITLNFRQKCLEIGLNNGQILCNYVAVLAFSLQLHEHFFIHE